MKKLLIVSLAIGLSCTAAMAAVQITWQSTAQEIFMADGTTFAPTSYLAHQIWSPDPVASAIDAANPLVPTGGEILLQTQNPLAAPGAVIGATFNGADSLAGGFVYTRVFDSATPVAGVNYYGDGVPTGNDWENNPDAPGLAIATGAPQAVNSHDPGTIVVGTLIPEPGTLALLGLGALTALWRRRR
mgnify:CR=1 FL=1